MAGVDAWVVSGRISVKPSDGTKLCANCRIGITNVSLVHTVLPQVHGKGTQLFCILVDVRGLKPRVVLHHATPLCPLVPRARIVLP